MVITFCFLQLEQWFVCRAGVFCGTEEVQRGRCCHLVTDRSDVRFTKVQPTKLAHSKRLIKLVIYILVWEFCTVHRCFSVTVTFKSMF